MRRKKKAKNIKKKLLRSISILLIALLLGSSFSVAGIASKAQADESFYDNANGFESAAIPEESEGGSEELPAEGETLGEEESESEPEESEIPDGESETPEESEIPSESKPHPSIDKTAPEFDALEGLIPERGLPDDDIIIEIESELDAPGEGLTESVVTIEPLTEEESLGGYVVSVVVTDIEDGTAPFDEVEAATPAEYKEKGIDTSSSNWIVRTFDTISYAVTATFGARDKEETATSATVCFEMTLPMGVTEARIDMDSMNWFKSANPSWQIDFLDESGDVVMIQKSDGCYYVKAQDEDGGTQADDASQGGDSDSDADEVDYSKFTVRTYIDALATGSGAGDESETTAYVSDGAESGAYMVKGIVAQRLRGTYELKAEDGTDNVLSSTKGWTAGVKVLNAKNDTTIAPSFRVWFEGNENNEGPVTEDEGEGGNEDSTAALDDDDNAEGESEPENPDTDDPTNVATAKAVTVTSSPRFDLQLTYDTYLMYNSWYDFSTGQEVTDSNLLNWLEEMSAKEENHGKVDPSTFTNFSKESITVSLTKTESANLSNIRYGQMNTLSIALHLANEYLSKKEMRGISFPTGEITFDIELKAEAQTDEQESADSASLLDASDESAGPSYYAVLWDYNENVTGTNTYTYEDDVTSGEDGSETHTHQRQGMTTAYQGNLGRNLSWDGISESRAGYNVPYAYMGAVKGGKVSAAYAYDSGYLTLTAIGGKSADGDSVSLLDGDGDGDGEGDDDAPALTTSATDANQIYSFSLTDYDIELDNYSFPTQTKGGSGRALGTTQFCVFSGMVQVLNVFPRVQAEAATINYTYTIGNLSLTDISGEKISPSESSDNSSGTIDYSYEVCGYGSNNDGVPYNEASGSLTLYPPGSSAKGNWFGGEADSIVSLDSNSRFSGIEWDAAALLGSDVYIIGRFEVGNSSSSRVGAMNYLQLFDSHGLYTRPNATTSAALEDGTDGNADGEYITTSDIRIYSSYGNNPSPPTNQSLTLLFAADPYYPSGYDTNDEEEGDAIQTYMNSVREEDLVYSDKLYKDSAGHYTILKTTINGTEEELTCIGYLLELRNTDFKSNAYYTFPMTITDEESMKTKTVMTVNAVRAWAAGTEDAQAMQSLSWANGKWDSDTSKNTLDGYKDITKRSSSGSGGTVTGNGWENNNGNGGSGYKKVEYGAAGYESGDDGGYQYGNTLLILAYTATLSISADGTYFDMDSDAGTVNYTIKDIETKFSQEQSTVSTTTDLCIYVDLDPYSSSGSAYPQGSNAIADYASIMSGSFAVSGTVISSDPEKPTTISYTDSDGEKKTYTVYVVISEDASSAVLYLSGVSVGDKLPDITFSAALGAEMENNDYVVAGADISGDGYVHAFDSASAMLSDCTIYTTRTSGTRLKKKVDHLQIEQGGTITYTLSYTNQSNGAVDMYLYDILPYNGDQRKTDYHGMTYLAGYEATVSGGDSATTTAYYSDDDQDTLTKYIANFGGSGKEGNESTIKGWLPGDGETSKETTDGSGSHLFTFTRLGDDSFSGESQVISATCVYFAINNLPQGATITLKIEMATELNKAYDIYGDYAYCWTTTSGSPLKSNLVQTVVTGTDSDTKTGDIIISTNAFGGDGDSNTPEEFTFTIELDTPLNGTYGDVTFTDGKATINIKSGESVTIEGLPEGTCYTVTEESKDGYTPNGGNTREGSVSGGETDKVHIDNITGDTGSVTVTTTASGSASSSNDEFSFTVTLDTPLNGTYGDVTFTDGVATFKLKSGQSVNISGIPAGVGYTVTETDANGYTVSGGTQTGSVTAGKTTVTIKNVKNAKGSSGSSSGSGGGGGGGSAYSGGGSSGGGPGGGSGGESVSTPTAGDSVPKTGDETHILLYTLMALIGLMGSAYCVRRLRYDE